MRTLLLIAILLPSMAYAADWIELGDTVEAQVMYDKSSVEIVGDAAKASLKFIYHKQQPGQTITRGKPFDSSINQYYLVCSTSKYQVLQLTMRYKKVTVGSFSTSLHLDNLDEPGSIQVSSF